MIDQDSELYLYLHKWVIQQHMHSSHPFLQYSRRKYRNRSRAAMFSEQKIANKNTRVERIL